MTIQLSVYEPCDYIFNPMLNSFPFKIKNSYIKLYSEHKVYLKVLVFVSVVIMEQSGGRVA